MWIGKRRKRQLKRIAKWIGIILLALVIIAAIYLGVRYRGYQKELEAYNELVSDYNITMQEYEKILEVCSVDNVDGMVKEVSYKEKKEWNLLEYIKEAIPFRNADQIAKQKETLDKEVQELVRDYLIAQQITAPDEDWVIEHLKNLSEINEVQAVTKDHDPNGLLGKEGGYTSCIYFSLNGIDEDSVSGDDVVDKGADAGGAVEIYETSEEAGIRCEYLSQFDDTFLYSGSYAIIGTMVIRVSYILEEENQLYVTDAITAELTNLEEQ